MALRNVVKRGDPILKKKARPVSEVTDRIRMTMEDMLETMRTDQGVGIAGPQVGVLRRMFVAEPEPGRVYYMINPEILSKEGSELDSEGCLSIPGLYGIVERPSKITMKAQDLNGDLQEYTFEGFDARVMCHEYDHLDGILFTDKAKEVHTEAEWEAIREQENNK
ncbi:MAG: peptide deformylase [Eubacteriales bacterium]|nr:peptide deformylase [Eubacteriales bacterium]